jgi:hypothetical protein
MQFIPHSSGGDAASNNFPAKSKSREYSSPIYLASSFLIYPKFAALPLQIPAIPRSICYLGIRDAYDIWSYSILVLHEPH